MIGFVLWALAIVLCVVAQQEDMLKTHVGPESVKSAQELAARLLIRGGTVVNADRAFEADVLVENGLIKEVGQNLAAPEGARVIEAKGKYVMPGGIDPHVHMELPFMGTVSKDDFYTGTAAALAGGTTMIIDFAIANPGESGLLRVYEEYRQKGLKAASDFSFHIGVVKFDNQTAADMEVLVKEKGINSFKFFMAYKNVFMVDDEIMYKAFLKAKELGAVPMVHAENGEMVVQGQKRMLGLGITGPEGHPLSRPPTVEAEAVNRAILLAELAGSPLYVVHVMAKESMEEISRAKLRGQRVIGEPILSGLILNDSHYYDPDWARAAQYVMSPPLRPRGHAEAITDALVAGTLSLVGTDHCVFDSQQKAMGRNDFTKIPNGLNGVEDRMSVLFDHIVASGRMSPSDFVRVTSTAAAQIFNIYPRKGIIQEGSDADIIVFDPIKKKTVSAKSHHQNIDYNVYEGRSVQGVVDVTISNGRVVFENGKLNAVRGAGRFVPTPAFPPVLYSGLSEHEQRVTPKPVKRD